MQQQQQQKLKRTEQVTEQEPVCTIRQSTIGCCRDSNSKLIQVRVTERNETERAPYGDLRRRQRSKSRVKLTKATTERRNDGATGETRPLRFGGTCAFGAPIANETPPVEKGRSDFGFWIWRLVDSRIAFAGLIATKGEEKTKTETKRSRINRYWLDGNEPNESKGIERTNTFFSSTRRRRQIVAPSV